jgi:8-amino-7-oxononanoate synthase
MAFFDDLAEELRRLDAQGRRRRMRPVVGPQAAIIHVDGREALNFSSNNYLGLAASPEIAAAAASALARFGPGAGASRLIAGTLEPHRQLEQLLARTYDFPAALMFNSGYQANVGIVSALAGPEDVVFSDALNHASLIDGCRLARARVEVYPHADLAELDRRLTRIPGRRRMIVSDTIFSMDGDFADVHGLRGLADRHGAALILDEAHAFGVLGPRGAGLAAQVGVTADATMATFSKALGGFGAFVAGPVTLTEYLRVHHRAAAEHRRRRCRRRGAGRLRGR